MELFWGDLHNHCGISYGFGSLENALEDARTHLDFCCVTGHAMWPDMYERVPETMFVVDFHKRGFEKLKKGWDEVRRMVNAYNDERLVTFQSYEMHSSKYGDCHFVSPDEAFPLIYRDSPAEIIRDCGCRAIAVPHHIGYTPGYRGISWELFDERISPVVEVYSKHGCAMREDGPFPYYHDMGPLDPRNTVAEGLRRGCHFSFAGSTDHHAGFPGSYGDGIAGVWAEEKTREAIWKAITKGHIYAASGDRIACSFFVNDAMMGDKLTTEKRHIRLIAEGDAPLESMTVRKNGRILKQYMPENTLERDFENRYKLRLEMGWSSSPDLYHWEGEIRVKGGEFVRVQPYLRGRNALSPSDAEVDSQDDTNRLHNFVVPGKEHVMFGCDTTCNKSTLHPLTSAFVFEVKGKTDAVITLRLNGQTKETTLQELLRCGYTAQMKPWHSHAYKMHTAYPAALCCGEMEFDDLPEAEEDVYQAEIVQGNGCRAFVSPIYVRA